MQFLLIGRAMHPMGPDGMWDEEDGFYYDVLRFPDASATRLKVRSMVGPLPLCAATAVERWQRERVPRLTAQMNRRVQSMPELLEGVHLTGPGHFGVAERGFLGLVNEDRLRRLLGRMLDENEFLSHYGFGRCRATTLNIPTYSQCRVESTAWNTVRPNRTAESLAVIRTGAGPIWMPVNALIIRALFHYYSYYGDLQRQLQD